MLYTFDLINNELAKRQYKNNNTFTIDNFTLPLVFFHLVKNNFDDAKLLLSQNIVFDDIKEYICQFDDIIEIDNQYYLSSFNNICKIKFKIENNTIIDVD